MARASRNINVFMYNIVIIIPVYICCWCHELGHTINVHFRWKVYMESQRIHAFRFSTLRTYTESLKTIIYK